MSIAVKICGIKDSASLQAAIDGGASYIGFVFVPSSRRYISVEQAEILSCQIPATVKSVGLFIDPSDKELQMALNKVTLNILQLHGNETPERIAEIRYKTKLPVIKAMRISTDDDFVNAQKYEAVCDMLLFDTKLSNDATKGGTGISFDWNLMKSRNFSKPWMLAGGLNIDNLAEAIAKTNAKIIDLSSGAEDAEGNKSPEKIRQILELAANI